MKIQVNARSRAHQFEAAASQKILHAGLAEAIGLPYECVSGTCGTCRARLIEGSIRNEWPEAPGSKYLKAPNEFLMCQCVAETDLAVEVASFVQELDAGACVPASVQGRIRLRDAMSAPNEPAYPGPTSTVRKPARHCAARTQCVPGLHGKASC